MFGVVPRTFRFGSQGVTLALGAGVAPDRRAVVRCCRVGREQLYVRVRHDATDLEGPGVLAFACF